MPGTTSPATDTLQKIRRSLLSDNTPEDSDIDVGSRYKVRTAVTMRASADFTSGTIAELVARDEVLLLSKDVRGSNEVGLVVPAMPDRPGWIVLRGPSQPQCSLVLKKLDGSWDMKARYRVTRPATLRSDSSIASNCLGEVSPGDEVLILDLGLDDGNEDKPRLRAQVSVIGTETVGWISPETYSGDRLLDPVNLLGPEIVKIHRKSLNGNKSPREVIGQKIMTIRGGKANKINTSPGPPRSCVPGQVVPWEVGGKYRILEDQTAREKPELQSSELFKIPAGAVVLVTDIQITQCVVVGDDPLMGHVPVALVQIQEGNPCGAKGWIRLAAKDGHDLVDTRDQNEFEKVLHRLRSSQQQEVTTAESPAGFFEASPTSSQYDEENGSGAWKGQQTGQESLIEKLEALEEGGEDRLVQDTSAVEDRNPLCGGCTCGSNRGI
mmetsp:Transcript_43256/g.85675  ORF Transcript_43256/g.85675 Transcript_43256/m.85675 type:complete len:438 (-) Transcript_43256:61-1374(-)